jgi:hypothetical protein
LGEVHPFSDTTTVNIVLQDANRILLPNAVEVGRKSASRIWGFMSKFAMLDRFSETLGVAKLHPGISMPKKPLPLDYFGTASKVSDFFINPPYFSQPALSC